MLQSSIHVVVSLGLLLLLLLVRGHQASREEGMSEDEIERRCQYSVGEWCRKYHLQSSIPYRPPPRGNKPCPNACSNIGNCNHDTGTCDCPAGRQGEDCSQPLKRPCFKMGPDRYDMNWSMEGWAPSRCAGVCDDNLAFCFCGWGKYKHVQDPNADPLAPPTKRGRPMAECQLTQDQHGNKISWLGPFSKTYEEWYGPNGWCNADEPEPRNRCPCRLDGWYGEFCDVPVEHFCPAQCSGRGTCYLGYCRCHPGWYGHDCSRLAADAELTAGEAEASKPFLKHYIHPHQVHNLQRPRHRPLIYIYDLPPRYMSQLLQYRVDRGCCTWRTFEPTNQTAYSGWTYGIESYLHEALLTSEHRTWDPEEADFFYVPVYTSCLIHPIVAFADLPRFPVNGGPRVMHASMALLEAKRWLEQAHPWWNRTGGKDHIWLISHDEGACWAPKEIWPSIMLSHWGRLDSNNKSETSYFPDDFNNDFVTVGLENGWLENIQYHPCFDPVKDLAIPVFKPPTQYHRSPLLGGGMEERTLLMFFRGDVGIDHGPPGPIQYSRGIRQQVYKLYKDERWDTKYNIIISYRDEHPGDYSQFLAKSIFCLAPPGEGWTARIEDAILNGCIPVIIMDNVQAQFESILDFPAFSIRIPQADIPRIPHILLAVSKERVHLMQLALMKVWQRFGYRSHPVLLKDARQLRQQNRGVDGNTAHIFRGSLQADDAFATVIQWLYSRIPATRPAIKSPE